MQLDDVNEFSPEFEQSAYSLAVDLGAAEWAQSASLELLQVRAHDRDCSPAFGTVCRYQLTGAPADGLAGLSVDQEGRIRLQRPERPAGLAGLREFQVLAYDCAGKKSQAPASVRLHLADAKSCRLSLRGKFSRRPLSISVRGARAKNVAPQ